MTAASTTTRKSTSRTAKAEQARAKLQAVPSETPKATPSATGRSATGDNGGGRKPKAQSQPKPATQPKQAKPTLGPSGYRAKFGLDDHAMLVALRADAAELTKGLSDADILGRIGWAVTSKSAIAKLRASA